MRASPSRFALWAPVVCYMALIFIASSISDTPDLGTTVPLADKLLHSLLYGGLGALLVRALAGGWKRTVTLRVATIAAVIATLYGASDETHQYFVPNRSVEALDVLADLIGASVASGALFAWSIIRQNPRQSG